MSSLTPSQRRGLRMAAQVACVAALVGAAAGTSRAASDRSADPRDETLSTLERTEDVLRLRGNGGGCFQPPTWGPPAPALVTERELAGWASDLAEVA